MRNFCLRGVAILRPILLLALLLPALLTMIVPATLSATPAPKQLLWRFDGQAQSELQGTTIASAGDVNGDAVADVIAGLWTVPSGTPGNKISARIYSGSNGQLLLTINAPLPQSGASANPVASLGDLTGDGRAEFAVGTPGAKVGIANNAGVVRVYSGNGALLATLTQPGGAQQAAEFGASVAAAGDTDADGRVDLIVGTPGIDAAFVFSGNPPDGFPLLASLDDNSRERSRFGSSVGRAGNLNAVPGDEVIVGAPYNMVTANRSGSAFVFAIVPAPALVHLVHGDAAFNLLGTDVDGGRDLSGDGVPDFLAGAMGTDSAGPLGTGFVRIYSGANGAVLRTIASDQQGDLFGLAASLSGPCAGAPASLIVGAPQAINPATGKATGRVLAYNAVSGAALTEIYGESLAEMLGISVGAFSDLSGDGQAEFLAGAQGMQPQPALPAAGAALVYSCQPLPRPDLVVTPAALDFGSVAVGASKPASLTLSNQGDAPLSVSGLTLLPGSGAFSQSGAAPFNLAPGASQTVSVQFSPGQAGVAAGTLRVQSNDPDSPSYDVPLTGKGVQAKIAVSPASAALGNIDVGDNAWAGFSVKNVGNQSLTVSGVALAPGGSGDYSLSGLPALPKTLLPGQSFGFQALLNVSGLGPRGATVQVASSDPASPTVLVPLSATGVTPNKRPTAVIKMDVPYSNASKTIQFRGDSSFDPDGSIVGYKWAFGDGGTSTAANPVHTFACGSAVKPCHYVVGLVVTDNGGKSDPTSVTSIVSLRDLRSRFYGTIRQGGGDVPAGTIVEAWIKRGGQEVKVAESVVQNHLGRAVYAIKVPPEIGSLSPIKGGENGEQVRFRYRKAFATASGSWYDATDQELNLSAPFYVPPRLDKELWCLLAKALGLEVCGRQDSVLPNGLNIELQEVPRNPIPDPGPLRFVKGFELTISDAVTGRAVSTLPGDYQITLSYSDAELAAAGIRDEGSLGLYYLEKGVWQPAGVDTLDPQLNKLVTTLNHASIFALRGEAAGTTLYLPVVRR